MRILAVAVLCIGAAAHASGFALENQSARATGMGNAFAAVSDDASAVFFNPAGLAGSGDRLSLEVGDTLLAPSVRYTSPEGTSTSSVPELSPPPHFYARYNASARTGLGLGVFSPYGSSLQWPKGWGGQTLSLSSKLATWAIEPAIAFAAHPRFRFGAGVSILRGTVQLERALDFPDAPGEVLLGGSAWGVGFHVGAQGKLFDDYLDVGAAWRSGARLRFAGSAHFSGVPPELSTVLKDQGVSTTVRMPDLISLGVASRPIPRLRLALDAHYTAWSQFQELRIDFDDPALTSVTPKKWHDTVSVHLGGEFEVTKELSVRAGASWDPTGSPTDTLTPDLPDATRYKFGAGAGYRFGAVRVDAAYQLVLLADSPSTAEAYPGAYSGMAHVVGLTLGFRLPGDEPTSL